MAQSSRNTLHVLPQYEAHILDLKSVVSKREMGITTLTSTCEAFAEVFGCFPYEAQVSQLDALPYGDKTMATSEREGSILHHHLGHC